jgi:hypothetical protein
LSRYALIPGPFADWLTERATEAAAFDASLPPDQAGARENHRQAVCQTASLHAEIRLPPGLTGRVAEALGVTAEDVANAHATADGQ